MALRFQKRVTLIPGIKLNFGKKGVSLSLGPRGSSMNLGSTGVHANLGITGTGLSFRERLDSCSSRSNNITIQKETNCETVYLNVMLKVDEKGILSFETEGGLPLTLKIINQIKKDHQKFIGNFLQKAANERNRDFNKLMIIHQLTPSPYKTRLI
jgi:hypothetical protein